MKDGYFLVLDFGTGAGRCVIFNTEGEVVSRSYNRWGYYTPPDMPFAKEFNPDEFWGLLCKSAREALKIAHISPDNILGISSTSMSHGCVFLNKNGKELYAGPNLDARGVLYQDFVESAVGNVVYEITGQWPPLLYSPARLQWFRVEKPEIFDKIAHVIQINDWVVYKLTGKYVTDLSIASNTMFLDLRKRTWSKEIIEKLNFDENSLPEIKNSGDYVGDLTEKAAKVLGLKKGIQVILGGRDTQMGMLGSGAINTDDVGIVAGATAPVCLVLSAPLIDAKRRTLTNCHAIPDKWLLESNSGMAGMVYDWLKDAICEVEVIDSVKENDDRYQLMNKLAAQIPPGSDGSFAILGSSVMNVREMMAIRPGLFIFPTPVLPLTKVPFTRKHLIRTTLESICFAIKGNFLQLGEISGKEVSRVKVTGGMTKSEVWVEMLANVLGVPVEVAKVKEGSSLGCSVCAATGIGMYKNLEEGVKALVKTEKIVEPKGEIVDIYKSSYERWRELYNKAPELL